MSDGWKLVKAGELSVGDKFYVTLDASTGKTGTAWEVIPGNRAKNLKYGSTCDLPSDTRVWIQKPAKKERVELSSLAPGDEFQLKEGGAVYIVTDKTGTDFQGNEGIMCRIKGKSGRTYARKPTSRVIPCTSDKENEPANKEDEPVEQKPRTMLEYVKEQGLTEGQIKKLNEYRKKYGKKNLPRPQHLYEGRKVLPMLVAALLAGHHVILRGPAGSGKNTAIDTAAYLLATPLKEIQGHTHLDADQVIGHEVFKSTPRDVKDFVELAQELRSSGLDEGQINAVIMASGRVDEVTFLHGTVALAAMEGHIVVIDEANAVRPEALIVTHSLRDYRRRIEIPGYGVIKAAPSFRMCLTMNPGYAGTTELNQATADGFVPIDVPPMSPEEMARMLRSRYSGLRKSAADTLAGLFDDILKAHTQVRSISGRALSVRAILQVLDLVALGIKPFDAAMSCFVGRTEDEGEGNIVGDLVRTRIPESWDQNNVFVGGVV